MRQIAPDTRLPPGRRSPLHFWTNAVANGQDTARILPQGRSVAAAKSRIVGKDGMKHWIIGISMSALSVALLAAPVVAQTAQPAEKPDSPATDSGITDIVVTARKSDERLQTVPITINAISGDDLEKKRIQTVTDIQFYAPGVVINPEAQGGAPDFSIRGARQNGIVSSQGGVATYLGYVPIPSTYSVAYAAYDLKSVQVLKGPQGTLFGKNTTGGAVIFLPNDPTDVFAGSIKAGYGNYHRSEVEGFLNVPVTDRLALRVSGNWVDRDGFTRNQAGPDLDAERHWSLRGIVRWSPIDAITNTTMVDYVKVYQTPNTGKLVAFGGSCYLYSNCAALGARELALGPRETYMPANLYQNARNLGVTNTTTIDLGGPTLRNVFGYRHDRFDDNTNYAGMPLPLLNIANSNRTNQYTNELTLQGNRLLDRIDYTVGLFYSQNDFFQGSHIDVLALTPTGGLPPYLRISPSNIRNTFRTREEAVFGQANYHFTDRLTLTAGARYSSSRLRVTGQTYSGTVSPTDNSPACANALFYNPATQTFDPATCTLRGATQSKLFTYNAALSFQITPAALVFANAGRGAQAGGINLRVIEPAYQVYKPERVDNYEAGAKVDWQLFGRPIRTNVTLFYAKYRDQQRVENGTYIVPQGQTFIATFNAASSTNYGAEAEITYRPTARVELSGFYSYIRARYDRFRSPRLNAVGFQTGDDLSGLAIAATPAHTANITGSYTAPLDRGSVRFSATGYYRSGAYVQDILQNNNTYIPQYALLNARIDLSGVLPVNIGFWMNNALNKQYKLLGQDNLKSTGFATYVYGAPRTFGADISFTF